METTDSSTTPGAKRSGEAAVPSFDALLARLNTHAASKGWGPTKSAGYRLQMADLAGIGASYVEGMGNLPAGGLDDARTTEIAKSILTQDEHAQKTVQNMRDSRSGLVGGAAKASGSAIAGGAQGALIGGVLALATRPLAWVANKITGGATKNMFSAKTFITIGALIKGGESVFKSLSNSYIAPGTHNRSIDEMSLDAVKAGIAKAAAMRTQTPGQAGPAAPGAPPPGRDGGPTSPSGGPAGGPSTVTPDSVEKEGGRVDNKPAPLQPGGANANEPFSDAMATIRAGVKKATGSEGFPADTVTEITPPEKPLDGPSTGASR